MSCGPSTDSCGRPDFRSCATLDAMIDLFLADRGRREDQEAAWYGDPALSLEQAIGRSMFMLGREDGRDRHQRPFSKEQLRDMGRRLAAQARDLDGDRPFPELYYCIERALGLRRHQRPLLVYDIASRLGHRLGIRPGEVWLHAGPRQGAEALRRGLGRPRFRPLSDFPAPIRDRLSEAQAEDFLCLAAPWLGPHFWS